MVMKLQKMSPPQNIFLKFPDESTRNIIKTNIIEENIRDQITIRRLFCIATKPRSQVGKD